MSVITQPRGKSDHATSPGKMSPSSVTSSALLTAAAALVFLIPLLPGTISSSHYQHRSREEYSRFEWIKADDDAVEAGFIKSLISILLVM